MRLPPKNLSIRIPSDDLLTSNDTHYNDTTDTSTPKRARIDEKADFQVNFDNIRTPVRRPLEMTLSPPPIKRRRVDLEQRETDESAIFLSPVGKPIPLPILLDSSSTPSTKAPISLKPRFRRSLAVRVLERL